MSVVTESECYESNLLIKEQFLDPSGCGYNLLQLGAYSMY